MLTPGEWIAAGSAIFTTAVVLTGAVYMRGKIDGRLATLEANVAKLVDDDDRGQVLDATQRGRQGVRDEQIDSLLIQSQTNGATLIRLEEGLSRHEKGCEARQVDAERRFSKLEARLDNAHAQIARIAPKVLRRDSDNYARGEGAE